MLKKISLIMTDDIVVPVFTADGTRSTKHERLLAVAHRSDALPDSFRRNNLKESLVVSSSLFVALKNTTHLTCSFQQLEYVDNFRKQFVQLYPDRPQLLLSPLNEAGVPKFVCTTLRPTQLPFREVSMLFYLIDTSRQESSPLRHSLKTFQLYDLGACATFFSSYLHYEPLDNPIEVPLYLPSPAFTLQSRVGDAFDLATVLASYLLGSGYDAYVVSGRAPRWLTLRQEDRSMCEWSPPADAVDRNLHTSLDALELRAQLPSTVASLSLSGAIAASSPLSSTAVLIEPPGATRYKLPPPPSVSSEYAKILHSNKTDFGAAAHAKVDGLNTMSGTSPLVIASEELRRMREEEGKYDSFATSVEPGGQSVDFQKSSLTQSRLISSIDPLVGQRVHAWVLVRAGRRDVQAHLFVEPSTGSVYPVTSAPYISIESMWNHRNYFVNMQNQPLIPRQQPSQLHQLSCNSMVPVPVVNASGDFLCNFVLELSGARRPVFVTLLLLCIVVPFYRSCRCFS